mgnify:FL=1
MEEEIKKQQSKTPLCKDTVTDLNRYHRFLMRRYMVGDTRPRYLRAFELILSQNCPKHSLWENERYIRVTREYPLPEKDDSMDYVPVCQFYVYLMLYEYIMRDVGLIGKKTEPIPKMKIFDMKD